MHLSKQLEKEVLQVYDTWLHSYMNGDVSTYDSFFDDDFHFIGSTGNEEFLNRRATTQFFESTADQMAGKTALRNETKTIEQFGDLVFITHLFDGWFYDGKDWSFYSRFRFTNALKKNKEGWRFIYQHYSTPDSRAQEGETMGIEQINAENQKLREAVKRRTIELEQKNRELEVETALERIRAQVTSMEKSEDLLDIVVSMRKEFVRLGHEAHYFWHMRWHPYKYEKAMTSGDGSRIGMVMELPSRIHGEIKQLAEWEKSEEPSIIFTMDVDAALDYVHKMIAWGDFQRVDPNVPTDDDIRHIGGLTYVMARTSLGEIGYSLPGVVNNVPQTDLDILVRFARAFDLAHKRFEDLKKSEQQARETQIELALEKVRSKTMGMQQSTDLAETASVLFQQIKELGYETWSCGFCIWQAEDAIELWMGADSGGLLPPMTIPFKEEPTHHDIFLAFQEGKKVHHQIWEGEALARHYEYLRGNPTVAKAIKILEDSGLSLPDKQCYYASFFKQGYLLLITKAPNEDLKEICRRFARVFDLTYTRFLDLQLKEEQATLIVQEKERLENTLHDLQITQAQLIHAEKMASLGELTAGIAHEIQNPLNFVNNFSEVSEELLDEMNEEIDNGDLDEAKAIAHDLKLNLKKINHHGQRAETIVKGMLQHSRKSSGEKTPTDMNKLTDEYLRLAYHGLRAKDKSFNANLNTDFDPTLEKISVVSQDLGRVLLNLINNAFYAVNEKRKTHSKGYQPEVTISTKQFADHIIVNVKDNGSGIPKQVQEKIFQPFFTTKPTGQGTGLGLSLSYDIVKAHGGEIKLESQVNEGTEFTILLPKKGQ